MVKPIPTMEELAKKKREQELDKFTMYLGRPERETKPWYTDRELKGVEEKEIGEEAEERRERERYAIFLSVLLLAFTDAVSVLGEETCGRKIGMTPSPT